jgi:hypothetical protein
MATKVEAPCSASEATKMALYEQGLTDREIAIRTGVRPNTVVVWRRERDLAVNPSDRGNKAPQAQSRQLLYELGWSDGHIARVQHVDKASVRDWRRRRHLPANFSRRGGTPRRQQIDMESVRARIVSAVGHRLPPDIAEDTVSDLMIAVIEGTLSLEAIERESRRFGNKVLERFASKFGPLSLDEELGDEDGRRIIDMIADERSSDWLEEMGATVW